MTPEILKTVKAFCDRYEKHGVKVIEIGSLNVNGSPRLFFTDVIEGRKKPIAKTYIGIDSSSGRGVDDVLDARNAVEKYGNEEFDIVLCLEVIEHDPNPHEIAEILKSLCKPGGYIIVSSPTTGFPEHKYPKDFWRLMPDAYEYLFGDLEKILFEMVRDQLRQPGYVFIGKKLEVENKEDSADSLGGRQEQDN